MKIILIAAHNRVRVIGKQGKIPWHFPDDLQRFKRLTTNHTVLMCRRTFESIGGPLPHRDNIVISKHLTAVKGIKIFPSIELALTSLHTEEIVYVIGGGEIFRQMIDRADALMLTVIENDEP